MKEEGLSVSIMRFLKVTVELHQTVNIIYSNFSTRLTNKWFFWNYALLSDLFNDDGFPRPGTEEWVIPVCQGFVAERLISNFMVYQKRISFIYEV